MANLLRLTSHLRDFLLRSFHSHHSPNDCPKTPELFRREMRRFRHQPARKRGRTMGHPGLGGGSGEGRRIRTPRVYKLANNLLFGLVWICFGSPQAQLIRLEVNVSSTRWGPVRASATRSCTPVQGVPPRELLSTRFGPQTSIII